jgi:cellulose synthase/poly-beta-1,6-N-acetylglucosamine synthase-like glycosyltransferase
MSLILLNNIVLIGSLTGVFCLFLLYPLLLIFIHTVKKQSLAESTDSQVDFQKVSIIIVVHNAEQLIVEKILNSLSLNYAEYGYEILIYLDGCSDRTLTQIQTVATDKVRWIEEKQHLGKYEGLNRATAESKGDILVFSDADAILENNAILSLVSPLRNPICGGVCGQRIVKEKQGKLRLAQSIYIQFDSWIKRLESQIVSISSNDGKLYAIKRHLFQPIPPAVTDDLYQALNIVEQGYRFVFAPQAKAAIKTPSRTSPHELERRRRIVATSLYGIFLKRNLLNPVNYGLFAIGLFINKLLRRFIPFLLILIFVSSAIGANYNTQISCLFIIQIMFYVLALSYPLFLQHLEDLRIVKKLSSILWYFCLGNFATLLGVWDFLIGKRVIKWQPQKTD